MSGTSAAYSVAARRADLPGLKYGGLTGFCDAIDWSLINRRAIESLAKAGALDDLGDRSAILGTLEAAIAAAQKRQRATSRGQMDLFAVSAPVTVSETPLVASHATNQQILEWEKELLGTYMSAHPLTDVLHRLRRQKDSMPTCEVAQLPDRAIGSSVRLVGMVSSLRRIVTKSNRTMVVMVVEDLSGQIDVVVFPNLFERQGQCLSEGAILEIKGRLDRRGEALQIVAESVSANLQFNELDEPVVESVFIRFGWTVDQWTDIKSMQEVDEILRRHEGLNPVVFEIPVAQGMRRHLRSRTRRVEWSERLEGEILAIPGVVAATTLSPESVPIAS